MCTNYVRGLTSGDMCISNVAATGAIAYVCVCSEGGGGGGGTFIYMYPHGLSRSSLVVYTHNTQYCITITNMCKTIVINYVVIIIIVA